MIDFLTIVYEDYCTKHSLPYVSADEQDTDNMDQKHVTWLASFIETWELCQSAQCPQSLEIAPFSCIVYIWTKKQT